MLTVITTMERIPKNNTSFKTVLKCLKSFFDLADQILIKK